MMKRLKKVSLYPVVRRCCQRYAFWLAGLPSLLFLAFLCGLFSPATHALAADLNTEGTALNSSSNSSGNAADHLSAATSAGVEVLLVSVSREYRKAVSEQAATVALNSIARVQVLQSATRILAEYADIRMVLGNQSLTIARSGDPDGLVYALFSMHVDTLKSAEAGERKTLTLESSFRLEAPAALRKKLHTLLNQHDLLLFFTLVAQDEKAAITAYDNAASAVFKQEALLEDSFNIRKSGYADIRSLQRHLDDLVLELDRCVNRLLALQKFTALLPRLHEEAAPWVDLYPAVKELATLAPDNYLILTELGRIELRLDNPERAKVALDNALALNENFAPIHDARGVALLRLNHPALARADFSQAIELDGSNPAYYFNRAMAQMVLLDTENMCLDLRQSCSLGECAALGWAIDEGVCQKRLLQQRNRDDHNIEEESPEWLRKKKSRAAGRGRIHRH